MQLTLRKADGTLVVYSDEVLAQANSKLLIVNGSSIEIRVLQLVQSTEQSTGFTLSESSYSGGMPTA